MILNLNLARVGVDACVYAPIKLFNQNFDPFKCICLIWISFSQEKEKKFRKIWRETERGAYNVRRSTVPHFINQSHN